MLKVSLMNYFHIKIVRFDYLNVYLVFSFQFLIRNERGVLKYIHLQNDYNLSSLSTVQ